MDFNKLAELLYPDSTLNIEDIEKKYTERVSSRIIGEFRILTLIGSDIRKKKMELNNGGKR